MTDYSTSTYRGPQRGGRNNASSKGMDPSAPPPPPIAAEHQQLFAQSNYRCLFASGWSYGHATRWHHLILAQAAPATGSTGAWGQLATACAHCLIVDAEHLTPADFNESRSALIAQFHPTPSSPSLRYLEMGPLGLTPSPEGGPGDDGQPLPTPRPPSPSPSCQPAVTFAPQYGVPWAFPQSPSPPMIGPSRGIIYKRSRDVCQVTANAALYPRATPAPHGYSIAGAACTEYSRLLTVYPLTRRAGTQTIRPPPPLLVDQGTVAISLPPLSISSILLPSPSSLFYSSTTRPINTSFL